MKSDIKQLLDQIKIHNKFAVFTHKSPDGDAIGGVCAFALMLKAMGKKVDCFVQMPIKDSTNISSETAFFESDFVERGYDCFVAVDCGSLDHLYLSEELPPGRCMLVIDHHYTNTHYGSINVVDENASSVGEVMYSVIKASGVKIKGEIAKNIYLSIVSDTWYFSFANTTPASMRIVADLIEDGLDFMAINEMVKARSLEKFELMRLAFANSKIFLDGKAIFMFILGTHGGEDTEGVVDEARNVRGCLFAAVLTQVSGEEFRASLRSNADDIDVSILASRFGGGGHKRASGFTFLGTAEALEKELEKFSLEHISIE